MGTERTYRCAACGREDEIPFGASVAAKLEAEARFGGQYKAEDMVVVCGACYKKALPKVSAVPAPTAHIRHGGLRRGKNR